MGIKTNTKYISFLIYTTAVRCTTLPWWSDTIFNTTEREYGTFVSYRCDEGFKFDDEDVEKTSMCSSDFNWKPAISACQGRLTLLPSQVCDITANSQ